MERTLFYIDNHISSSNSLAKATGSTGSSSNYDANKLENIQLVTSALGSVLERFLPLPREALFLGIASDGWPVLLNMLDPSTGPILIVGDSGAGKTLFLQNIALAVNLVHPPKNLQYGILTADPGEWSGFTNSPFCIDVFNVLSQRTTDFLRSLQTWTVEHNFGGQTVLVLLDGLERIADAPTQIHQFLHWLFCNGPSNLVWPIVTLNAELLPEAQDWLRYFQTHIIGCINHGSAYLGIHDNEQLFTSLHERGQFLLRDENGWLEFRPPGLK